MSTNKTPNYDLHSWVPEDSFQRSEFNDNFASLDSALKTLSDNLAAETAAREAAVAAEAAAREEAVATERKARQLADSDEAQSRDAAVTAEQVSRQNADSVEYKARTAAIATLTASKAEIVTGVYTGDGAAERTIELGFQPKAVLLIQDHGKTYVNWSNSDAAYGGLFLPGHPLKCSPGGAGTPTEAAEIVSTGFLIRCGGYSHTNDNGDVYHYLAVK